MSDKSAKSYVDEYLKAMRKKSGASLPRKEKTPKAKQTARKKATKQKPTDPAKIKAMQKYMRDNGLTRFWDDDNQKAKAERYAKSNGLNFDDIDVKITLRATYRTRENRNKDGTPKGDIPRQIGHGGILGNSPIFPQKGQSAKTYTDEDITKEEALNKISVQKKKAALASTTSFGNRQEPDYRRKKPSSRSGKGEDKPAPTGFVSKLSDEDWLVYYVPQLFGDGLYDVQQRMLEHIQDEPWNMIKVFRSAGKTWLGLALKARRLCDDPERRIFILGEEYKKTVQRVRFIRNLLASPRIVEDYGYLINDASGSGIRKGKSTEGMFECYRQSDTIEPSVMAITWKDSQALGMHYTDGLIDDPWSNKLQNTTGAVQKWLDWWAEFQGSLDGCKELSILCTRKGLKDLYFYLGLQKQFKELTIPLVEKPLWDNCKLLTNKAGDMYIGAKWRYGEGVDYILKYSCKGKYSMTKLKRGKGKTTYCVPILRHNNPMSFEQEYQQNPFLPEGNVFKWKHANLYNEFSTDVIVKGFYSQFHTIKKIAIMDVAYGESDSTDLNCMYVMGMYRKRFFIIDAWIGKWSDNDRFNVIKTMERKYGGIPIYVEADLANIMIFKDLKKKFAHLKIRKFISKGKGQAFQHLYEGSPKAAKKGKIHSALTVPWSDGSFYIPDKLEGLEELQNELVTFPNCAYFDCVDTLAMGTIVLRTKGGNAVVKVNRISMGRRGGMGARIL